jgi:outer membrane protein assembly factor BamA
MAPVCPRPFFAHELRGKIGFASRQETPVTAKRQPAATERCPRGIAAVAACLAMLAGTPASADPSVLSGHAIGPMQQAAEHAEFGFRNGSLVVAPIPFSNPMIGTGLALGTGYLFKSDDKSDSSYIGIGGMKSDNGSIAYGAAAKVAFGDNRWRLGGMVAQADANYDLFLHLGGATQTIPINQTGTLANFDIGYGVTETLFLGAAFRYLTSTISSAGPGLLPPAYALDADLELFNYALTIDWDRRDDTLYPTTGTRVYAQSSQGMSLTGLGRDYNRSYMNADTYLPIGSGGVLAARLSGCTATRDSPFFYKCSLGMTDGFRGFSATRYLGEQSVSAQVEYRQKFGKRLGAVAFAGAGQVRAAASPVNDGVTHWAGGLGLRFQLSRKFPLDFSVDGSRNSDGDNLLYVYVGQRF